ncbi:hypothetical protein [Ponticoccus sp. (in: a-proteobacteria)]|uniref:hypothetical protein n=1 Tax=Ponticoccus sp. (in: a-proteobacteria) TaxID=1925025 RepID=UPI003AB67ED3
METIPLVTDLLNRLNTEAWAGIAAVIGVVASAIFARRGAKKTPIEVGSVPPEVARTEYVLREVRSIYRRLDVLDDRVQEIDRRTEAIKSDTRVLIDRRS